MTLKTTPYNPFDYLETQEEINEWKEVEEAFITSIIKKGRVLYENKKGQACSFRPMK